MYSKAWNFVRLCLKLKYVKCFMSRGLHTELSSIHGKAFKNVVAQMSTALCLIQPPLIASWKCLGIAVVQPSSERRAHLCICFLGFLNENLEILILTGMCIVTG